MTVSDEAVEAAARVRFGASGWATAPEWWKEFERRTLRTTLEAAAPFMTNAPGPTVLVEVAAERERQDAKWGEQNHPNGTGDNQEFIRPAEYVHPAGEHILATMGTFAYRMKHRTDERAQRGTVTFADILLEEVFEALAEEDPAKLRTELIQVAAVAAQWVEAIDRTAS